MKKFNVTVNGKLYEVEVEETGADGGFVHIPVHSEALQAADEPYVSPVPKADSGPVQDKLIAAPMPGTILDIRVSEGQQVKNGDIILILEAMKMENEIAAPKNGTVRKLYVKKGTAVNTGDALVYIG